MKILMRYFFAIIFIAIVAIGAFLLIERSSDAREKKLTSLIDLDKIKSELGNPFYTYTAYPPQFGVSMVNHSDFENGIIIEAYLFQKSPPRFLIIKRRKESNTILDSIIESS